MILAKKQPGRRLVLDYYLLLAVVSLIILGLIMVASSSMVIAEQMHVIRLYFFIKQAIYAVLGICVASLILYVPTRHYQRFKHLWLIMGIVLLVLVLIPGIGHVVNGSRRWIRVGPIAIQVSEVIKLLAIMYLSGYLVKHALAVRETLLGVVKPLALLSLFAALLLLEPDFGATVVLFATALGMMFMAGVRVRWFILLIALGAILVTALVFFSPYRLARLTGFLHPWVNQFDSGYQLTQSLIAFGRGGWFGVGLGNSVQKLFYLPEAYTDFVFAIMGEELGLFGVLGVLALFAMMVWRGLLIARAAHVKLLYYDAYLAYGITFWLGLQVVVNIGVNVGLLPTKGLTLPFISYGGSSLLLNCIVVAMLLRVDMQTKLAPMEAKQAEHVIDFDGIDSSVKPRRFSWKIR